MEETLQLEAGSEESCILHGGASEDRRARIGVQEPGIPNPVSEPSHLLPKPAGMIASLTVTILAVELCTVILYLSPLSTSMRRTLVNLVERSSLTASVSPYIRFFPAVAASAFVYALLEVTRAQSRLEAASDGTCAQLEPCILANAALPKL